MKKSRKRLMILFVIALVVLSYTGTALAAGETLHHWGWSRYSYTGGETVPQKTDNNLYCYSAPSTYYYTKCIAYADDSRVSTNEEKFDRAGLNLYVPDTNKLRDVAIRIINYDLGVGVNVYTEGFWVLNV